MNHEQPKAGHEDEPEPEQDPKKGSFGNENAPQKSNGNKYLTELVYFT